MKILKLIFLFIPFLVFSQTKTNKYEYVYGFENGYAVFRTFGVKMGVMDSTKTEIIKPNFDYIYNKKSLKDLFEVGNNANKTMKRGYIDKKGNIKIPIIYDDVYYFEQGLIRITKDKKTGVIDTLNNIILPLKFDYISLENNRLIVQGKEFGNLYDLKGKLIVDLQFTYISNFIQNKAIVSFKDKTTAVIDDQGSVLLKPIKNHTFEEILNNNLYLIRDNQNLKKGIVDSLGKFKIECKYDEIDQSKMLFIAKSKGKKGFISVTDSIIKPFVYDEIYSGCNLDNIITFEDKKIGENYIAVKNKLQGVLNPYLKNEVIPFHYTFIETILNQYYLTENSEHKNGLYYTNGQTILKEEYEFYNYFGNKIFAMKNNKPYLIRLDGTTFSEIQVPVDAFVRYSNNLPYSESASQISKVQAKFGVINAENKIIIPFEYQSIENIYRSSEFIVKKNNKYGIVNSQNEIVLEIEYDTFKILKETVLFTKDRQTIKKLHDILLDKLAILKKI